MRRESARYPDLCPPSFAKAPAWQAPLCYLISALCSLHGPRELRCDRIDEDRSKEYLEPMSHRATETRGNVASYC
jgi:hypothetical protein